jgi:hypothetical protein
MPALKMVLFAGLFGGFLMSSQAAPNGLMAPPLQGIWGSVAGGERMLLTVDAKGGRFEMDCASGTLVGPVNPGGDGKFQATGSFEPHQAGAQPAEKAPAQVNARFAGQLQDGVLKLTVIPEGSTTPQVFTLREGQRVKLLRCL